MERGRWLGVACSSRAEAGASENTLLQTQTGDNKNLYLPSSCRYRCFVLHCPAALPTIFRKHEGALEKFVGQTES